VRQARFVAALLSSLWCAPAWAQGAPPPPPPPADQPVAPPVAPPVAQPPPAQPPPVEQPPPAEQPAPVPQPPPVDQPPPVYPQPYQPDYGPPPGYEPGYGPPQPRYGNGPPPPPLEPEKECCLWSIRYDPFDLLFRRLTFEAELALGDLPLTVELSPAWIWSSPSEGVEEKGFDIAARFGWYVQGNAMRGFWLKAHAEFETFDATLFRGDTQTEEYFGKPNAELCDADSATGTCTRHLHDFILGIMLGTSAVFPNSGGFIIHGGIGIGAAVVDSQRLEVDNCTADDVTAGDPHCATADDAEILVHDYFDKTGRIRLLGNLSLGVAF
jgi:hypothetical protein